MAFGSVRAGRSGMRHCATCTRSALTDQPCRPTTRCQGIRCSHFPPSKWAAFRRKCQLAEDERRNLDNDCRELALLIPEGVGRPRRLSAYVIGILSHGRAGGAAAARGEDPQLQQSHLRAPNDDPGNGAFYSLHCECSGHDDATIKPRRRPSGPDEEARPAGATAVTPFSRSWGTGSTTKLPTRRRPRPAQPSRSTTCPTRPSRRASWRIGCSACR